VSCSSTTPPAVLDRRPELDKLLQRRRQGDSLVMWRLDRLGRSLRHLIDTVAALGYRGSGTGRCRVNGHDCRGWRLLFHPFVALAQFSSGRPSGPDNGRAVCSQGAGSQRRPAPQS